MDHPLLDNLKGNLPAPDQEEVSARQRALKANLPYANLKQQPISLDILNLLSLKDAQEFRILPFARQGRVLRVASVTVPLGPAKTRLVRLEQQSGYEIEVNIVSPGSLNSGLTLYAQHSSAQARASQKIEKPAVHDYLKEVTNLDKVKELVPKASVTDLFDVILAGAINASASDIHIEPNETDFVIRYRLDGVLTDVVRLPASNLHGLISRIKILAHLRLDQDQVAQDGSFARNYPSLQTDFRVSILPTQFGESVVLRIARSDQAFLPLADLGFSSHDQARIKGAADKNQGIIIVSGPTGSGKTSSLYAILNYLISSEKKIITLEDPIEYHLPGVQQSQINRAEKYDFAQGLREVLRQDPNVIMVGEVRDGETANTAFDAAITGHLVLTTMHAPTAVQTFARLIDLGVPFNLLSGTVNLVINQRLVRRLCRQCLGKGCARCQQSGYKGRILIGETLVPSPEFDQALIKRQDYTTLTNLVKEAGLISMKEDAESKVRDGITNEEEVGRVLE